MQVNFTPEFKNVKDLSYAELIDEICLQEQPSGYISELMSRSEFWYLRLDQLRSSGVISDHKYYLALKKILDVTNSDGKLKSQ